MSYKPKKADENKKAVVHLLHYLLLSNITSQLKETGPLNSSCSLACTTELTQSPLLLAIDISSSLSIAVFLQLCTITKKIYFLAWVPLIFASKIWCLVT